MSAEVFAVSYFLYAFVQAILSARAAKNKRDPVSLVIALIAIAPAVTCYWLCLLINKVITTLVTWKNP